MLFSFFPHRIEISDFRTRRLPRLARLDPESIPASRQPSTRKRTQHNRRAAHRRRMDDFIASCLDEIALEGPGGCTLDRLWGLIATNWQSDGPLDIERLALGLEPSPVTEMDDALRNYVWPFLLSDPDVSIAGDAAVTKEDLMMLHQEEILARYGNRLRVVASDTARAFSLGTTTIRLSEINYKTLWIIAKMRAPGVTQFDLAKILQMDPRNLFHQIKVLVNAKLIVKFPVTIKGSHSNLCIHRRFAKKNDHFVNFIHSQRIHLKNGDKEELTKEQIQDQMQLIMEERKTAPAGRFKTGDMGTYFQCEMIRHRVTVLLAGAENNVLLANDIMDILIGPKIEKLERKMFNKVLGSMAEKGYIEIFETPVPKGGDSDQFSYSRCLRLLKFYYTSNGGSTKTFESKTGYYVSQEYKDKMASEPEKHLILGLGTAVVDLPLDYQVYQVIEAAGTSGTTSNVIRRSLSNLASRILERILKRLQKPLNANTDPAVQSDLEFQGRERRYRYYTSANYYLVKGTFAENESRLTSLVDSALQANQIFTPGRPVKQVARPSARFATKMPSGIVRKRKYGKEEDAEDVEMGDSDEDDLAVIDPTVSLDSPRALRTRSKPVKFVFDLPEDTEPEDGGSGDELIECSKCKENKDDELILLCDCCDKGRHTYCAAPPLDAIPEGDWFCSEECKAKGKPKEVEPPKKKRITLGSDDEESDFEAGGGADEPSSDDDDDQDLDDGGGGESKIIKSQAQKTTFGGSQPFLYRQASSSLVGAGGDISSAVSKVAGPSGMQGRSASSPVLGSPVFSTPAVCHPEPPVVPSSTPPAHASVPFSTAPVSLSMGFPLNITAPIANLNNTSSPQSSGPASPSLVLPATSRGSTSQDLLAMVANSSKAKRARNPMHTGPSLNGIKREKVLLQLLESKKIIELNIFTSKQLDSLLQTPEDKDAPIYAMDKKTLQRTAQKLERENKLRIIAVQIPKLNGKSQSKQLLLDNSLAATDQIVQDYIDHLSEASMNVHEPKIVAYERESVPNLDRPLDLHRKFIGEGEEAPEFGIGVDLQLAKENESLDNELEIIARPDPFRFWLAIAKKYGYMLAKVIRVKMVHEWLFTQFVLNYQQLKTTMGQTREKGVFSVLDIYNYMTLDLFLRVVGITSDDAVLNAYIENGNDPECPLKDLPQELRRSILDKTYKLKSAVLTYLDYLQLMNVITVLSENVDPAGLSVHDSFRVNSVVPIHDYRKRGAPLVRDCIIESRENLRQYWLQLEYLFRKLVPKLEREEEPEEAGTEERPAKRSRVRHEPPKGATPQAEKVLMLLQPRNWQSSYLFSAEEIAVLESHIDRKRLIFPVDDNVKIKALADGFGIAPAHVKHYFYRVQQNYERRILILQDRRRAIAEKRGEVDDESRAVLDKNRARVRAVLERAGMQSVLPGHGSGNESDDQTRMEIVPKRRMRWVWNIEEEVTLMHAYAIVRHLTIARETRFSWNPIAAAVSTSRELCRRKIATLLKSRLNEERINFLVAEWSSVFDDARRKGLLPEIPIGELLGINIDEHVKYYCSKSNLLARTDLKSTEPIAVSNNVSVLQLPEISDSMEAMFRIYPFLGAQRKISEFREQIADAPTIRSKMSVLYNSWLLSEIEDEVSLDLNTAKAPTTTDIAVAKLMSCAKSCMMTPEVRYNSEVAFKLLHQFRDATISRGLNNLLFESSLVKTKNWRDRHVPGRSLTLSDKFLTTISGVLPTRLIPQAIAGANKVHSGPILETRPLPYVDNGVACVLLDSLLTGSIKLVPSYATNSDDPNILYKILTTDTKMEVNSVNPRLVPIEEWQGDIRSEVVAILAALDTPYNGLVRVLYSALQSAGKMGLNLIELKAKIKQVKSRASDADILGSLKLLRTTNVGNCDIRVVSKVGEHYPVFVAAEFIRAWMSRVSVEDGEEEPLQVVTTSFPLRLWYDIHGNLIQSALRACLECVMSHIVETPGIYESTLRDLVKTVMNGVELSDVLEMLIDRQACRKVCLIKPKPFKSLFDAMNAPRAVLLCEGDLIDKNKVTSYFPLPGWFNVKNEIA
ncbi:hypothetical protein BC830DRAFT_961367 [Chytriomyces sp. MP71]|nr:hypothetical protein BC830DRAFT_961367 [Chytriomyces sp. MP71]